MSPPTGTGSVMVAGPTSTGSRRACCASSTSSRARGDTSRALSTRNGRRSRSPASPLALLISAISPRSSTDRAPSFYLGTVRVRVLPRAPSLQSQCVHVAQWTRAEASEASGCAFESRRGRHFDNDMSTNGELAERQGTAVLTRRDLRVGQVRLLHSPPLGRRGYSLTTITTVPVGGFINPSILVTSKPRMTARSVDTVSE